MPDHGQPHRLRPRRWFDSHYFQRLLDAEILEGRPARRIREFADHRAARFVVVGSRRRRFKRSVSERVVRHSPRPVVVAAA